MNPYKEPPGRKGGMEQVLGDGNEAVFTGHPASATTPPSESPQATGNGVKPALSVDEADSGKVIATALHDT